MTDELGPCVALHVEATSLWPLGQWHDVPHSDLQVMARPQDIYGKFYIRVKPQLAMRPAPDTSWVEIERWPSSS